MSFVYPSFLYALILLTVPVIIHLFNFRRYKTVYFSNLKFLKEIKEETQSTSQLKQLLLLLSRLLVFFFLILAFAQPYIPSEKQIGKQGTNAVSIYIDNSFSMQSIGEQGPLIEEAKNKALEIVEAFSVSDEFQLLTNDFSTKQQHFISKEEFIENVTETETNYNSKNLSQILKRQESLLLTSDAPNKQLFVISDFQKNRVELEKIDSSIRINLIPLEANEANNLYIDSCWFENPFRRVNEVETISVRIVNKGNRDLVDIPIRLSLNNELKAPSSFSITANSEIIHQLNFTVKQKGNYTGDIQIEDYPVIYDDHCYFSYTIDSSVQLLVINDKNPSAALNTLFKNDPDVELTNIKLNEINYADLGKYDLIILNELHEIKNGLNRELIKTTEKGSNLCIIPSMSVNLLSYQTFLSELGTDYYILKDTHQTKADYINIQHDLYKNVFEETKENIDLPWAFGYYHLSTQLNPSRKILMRLKSGKSLLNSYRFKNAMIYLFTSSFQDSSSTIAKHSIVVPTLYNMALFSQKTAPLYFILGKQDPIELNKAFLEDGNFHIRSNTLDFIPEKRLIGWNTVLYTHDQITEAAHYMLSYKDELIRPLSYNYNRKESDLSFLKASELMDLGLVNQIGLNVIENSHPNLSQLLKEQNQGKMLWKLCIIFTLIFLIAEMLLLKFWKT